jgi:predicted amino acid dehydrogenase
MERHITRFETQTTYRFAVLRRLIMATAQELQAGLDTLSAAINDYTSDVGAAIAKLSEQQTAMQATLDAALANDANDAATIADLKAQLAAMGTATESVSTGLTALADAVKAADVSVNQGDQPAPPSA